VYEMAFDASDYLGEILTEGYTAHWTMTCGNDAIDLTWPGQPVPEPTTAILMGMGLVGLAARRRFFGSG